MRTISSKSYKLPTCYRLISIGDYFFEQKCMELNITVGGKQTACGYEPFFEKSNNRKIRIFNSPFWPFHEYFWKYGIVNLNGKTFKWNKEKNDWTSIQPTFYQSTLHLAIKFNEINENHVNYQLNHHEFYQKQEYEKVN